MKNDRLTNSEWITDEHVHTVKWMDIASDLMSGDQAFDPYYILFIDIYVRCSIDDEFEQ